MNARLLRHYRFQRQWRRADPSLSSEREAARRGLVVRTAATAAVRTARSRIEAAIALRLRHPAVAEDYDATDPSPPGAIRPGGTCNARAAGQPGVASRGGEK